MQKSIKAAAVQFTISLGDVDQNLAHVTGELRRLAREGVELAVLPEMWSCGFAYRELNNLARRTPELVERLTDLVDGDDVRVVEIGDGFGLGTETFHLILTGEAASEDGLQRDGAVQFDLTGLVDGTHAALGDAFEEFVCARRLVRASSEITM